MIPTPPPCPVSRAKTNDGLQGEHHTSRTCGHPSGAVPSVPRMELRETPLLFPISIHEAIPEASQSIDGGVAEQRLGQ